MEIILVAVITIFAAAIGTTAGFGISTVMVPVLLLFLPLPETLLLVGIIHWFGDIWKIILFRSGLDWKLVLSFGIPAIGASFLGASFVLRFPSDILMQIIGGLLVAYVLFLLIEPRFRLKKTITAAASGGLLAGFIPGFVGIGGEIRSAFLTAFDLRKSAYIFTNGVLALAIDSVRITTYAAEGIRLEPIFLWGLLAFIPASFLGAKIAQKVVDKIPQKQFRLFVALFLFLVGAKLLIAP